MKRLMNWTADGYVRKVFMLGKAIPCICANSGTSEDVAGTWAQISTEATEAQAALLGPAVQEEAYAIPVISSQTCIATNQVQGEFLRC